MRPAVTALNMMTAIYFFLLANVFFWGSILLALAPEALQEEAVPGNMLLVDGFAAFFLIYGTAVFMRANTRRYKYGLTMIPLIWVARQLSIFADGRTGTDVVGAAVLSLPLLLIGTAGYLELREQLTLHRDFQEE